MAQRPAAAIVSLVVVLASTLWCCFRGGDDVPEGPVPNGKRNTQTISDDEEEEDKEGDADGEGEEGDEGEEEGEEGEEEEGEEGEEGEAEAEAEAAPAPAPAVPEPEPIVEDKPASATKRTSRRRD